MKILQVLNNFLPKHVAGTEIYAYSLGRELRKSGHEILFVIPGYGSNKDEEYVHDGFRVIRYAEPSVVDRALKMGLRKPDGLNNFINIIRQESPDIVHFHEIAGSNGITLHHLKAAKAVGLKVVMTLHLGKYTASYDSLSMPIDVFDNKRGAYNFLQHSGLRGVSVGLIYNFSNLFRKFRIDTRRWGRIGTALYASSLIEQKKRDFLSIIKNSDRVVTIANWYRNLLIENGIPTDRLDFIEQGINYELKVASSLGTSSHKSKDDISLPLKIIFVGRISRFKGIKMLMEAVDHFNDRQILLDIYGDSGEDDDYIRECKNLARGKTNICLKGRLNADEVIPKMSEYDLLVLPSTIPEMSPLVIREAYAAGIPVLASDSPGSAEQIAEEESGWLFKMNDRQDLVSKLQMLIAHPDKIEIAKRHLPPVRTMKDVAEEYGELYFSR